MGFHEPAEIVKWNLSDKEILRNDEINTKNGNGNEIASQLLRRVRPNGKLSHWNKVCPQDHVRAAIRDMIWCLGLDREDLEVVRETSFFSLHPGLVAVVYQGRILFVLEIKNPPTKDDEDLFKSETTAGQVLDYLMALRQQGITCPFVFLSTYNNTVLARLEDDEQQYKNAIADGIHNAKNEPQKRFANRSSELTPPPPGVTTPPDKPSIRALPRLSTISASEKATKSESVEKESDSRFDLTVSEELLDGEFDYRGRKVCYSQIFSAEKFFALLATVIEGSLSAARNPDSPPTVLSAVPSEGQELPRSCLFTLYPSGFAYEKVHFENVTYNAAPAFQPWQKYHVIAVLGRGRTGRTFLCCTSTGRMFAAKLFLPSVSTSFVVGDPMEAYRKEVERLRGEAEKEAKLWIEHGPSNSEEFCTRIEMNGLPALTMPVYSPIPMSEREGLLPQIKQKLVEFATEKRKVRLMYGDYAVKWGHIGYRTKDDGSVEITLLDLESMTVEDKTKRSDREALELVDQHVDQLSRRLTTEEATEIGYVPFPKVSV